MQIFNSITTLYRLAKRPRNRQWNTAICMNNFLRLSKTSCQLRRNELRIKLLSSRKISHRFSSQQLRQTQVSRLYLNLLSVFASSQGRVELKTKVLGHFLFFLAIPLLLFSRCFFFTEIIIYLALQVTGRSMQRSSILFHRERNILRSVYDNLAEPS